MEITHRDPFDIRSGTGRRVLLGGGVIVYPTDTIWGIGCDATDPAAVEKVFALKKRTESKSLIVLVDSQDSLLRTVRTVPEPPGTLSATPSVQ